MTDARSYIVILTRKDGGIIVAARSKEHRSSPFPTREDAENHGEAMIDGRRDHYQYRIVPSNKAPAFTGTGDTLRPILHSTH